MTVQVELVPAAAVAAFFEPEVPGPLIGAHVAASGVGSCRVDRWPDPRTVVAELPGGNVAVRGEPVVLPGLRGLVDAPTGWLPALRAVDPGVAPWARLIAALPPSAALPSVGPARRLSAADAAALGRLDDEVAWISETWGGPAGLAASGRAWGVVDDAGAVLSVAGSFYVGRAHEDVGVVTVAAARGRGLSTACAAGLAADVRARGLLPTWSTSPANTASRAVAARLGFRHVRDDVLHAVGIPVPD